MQRPPESVRIVAGTHAVVGSAFGAAIALVHFSTRDLPISFSPKAYVITCSLAGLYLLTSGLVWQGWAPGQGLSRLCSLLYVMRPRMAHHLSELMRSPEFKAHFARPASRTPASG